MPDGWSDTERTVARVWAEHLGIDEICPGDNFFVLGGRSLAAMRVVIRIRQEAGVQVALVDLFRTPVLREFATLIDARSQR